MGSWSVACNISNIAITAGNKCVMLPLKKNRYSETRKWQAATLPIFGSYDDYGGIEDIEEDDNTKMIEEYFGISIAEFAEFLVDGKFTYDRDEAKETSEKMKNFKEAEDWRFMWIDRQVYDFMILNHDEHDKGYNDYGTPEMMERFGFKLVENPENVENYAPDRFNQLWRKGDVELYSDGETLLSKESRYVYHFGKGDEYSLETYFEVPEEFQYLKDKSKYEAWRLMSESKARLELSSILSDRYDFEREEFEELRALLGDIIKTKPKLLHQKYYADLDRFGDRIVGLVNLLHNLYPMSSDLTPHVLYLTPQCGEYREHQKILEKFSEINKSYIHDEDE